MLLCKLGQTKKGKIVEEGVASGRKPNPQTPKNLLLRTMAERGREVDGARGGHAMLAQWPAAEVMT